MLANLPVGEADPLGRLDLIREQMDELKHTHQAMGAEVLTESWSVLAAPMLLALGTQVAFRIPQPLVQTVTTNVPGPRFPLYVLGRHERRCTRTCRSATRADLSRDPVLPGQRLPSASPRTTSQRPAWTSCHRHQPRPG